jgi:uncharacterized membrane protein (DUF373 family)
MHESRDQGRSSGAGGDPGRLANYSVRSIEVTEDVVHMIVALLLLALGITMVVDAARQIVAIVSGPVDLQTAVTAVLDETLLLFIIAELLHTVAIAIHHHGALDPEPFLVVGLVASIRRVLIVTAEAEQSFHWNSEGFELLVLLALILGMAVAALAWRRSAQPPAL